MEFHVILFSIESNNYHNQYNFISSRHIHQLQTATALLLHCFFLFIYIGIYIGKGHLESPMNNFTKKIYTYVGSFASCFEVVAPPRQAKEG